MILAITQSVTLRIVLPVCWVVTCSLSCYSSDIVLLDKSPGRSPSQQEEEVAAGFYGLRTTKYQLRNTKDISIALNALRQKSTVAVIVTAETLGFLHQEQLLSTLRREGSKDVPLLVIGITAETKSELLKRWSAGAIVSCRTPSIVTDHSFYSITTLKDVTRQLSGQKLAARLAPPCALTVNETSGAQSVMMLSSDSSELPVFVRTEVGKGELFFSADLGYGNETAPSGAYDQSEYQFSAVAPLMIFLRYAAGDRAWHSNGHYANLTVDDAWLREPYGHLQYSDLLQEMQQHNFHTTIAFVPWNFDRSDPQVVSLLRAHSDRFSICVHGNNHDHQEFSSLQDRSSDLQTANIRQALARMKKFESLTQLPYDRVMVFPHSIAPPETLGSLKHYNFLATANSRNIPLGSNPPLDPGFALRPMTLAFSNFPSLRRYSAEVPLSKSELAVNAFLDNPMLFYVHEAYFAEGIGRFDPVASTVNQLQPDTLWRGLGYIAEHLYLERSRYDGKYEIQSFTSNLQLENVHRRDAIFLVEKDEDFRLPLTLLVDGHPHAYSREGNRIRFEIPVPAGMTRQIAIRYQEDLDLSAIDISKSSLRIACLRYLSDFRDNFVSRSATGRKLIRVYTNYEAGWNEVIVAVFVSLLFASLAFARRRKHLSLSRGPKSL
jgi:hypothetical protein